MKVNNFAMFQEIPVGSSQIRPQRMEIDNSRQLCPVSTHRRVQTRISIF